jgi:Ca-activated chloride channel family protein
MGDPASPKDDNAGTKLDLAKQAIHDAVALFSPDDVLGFDIFSTGLGPNADQKLYEVIPPARVADIGEKLQASLTALSPFNDTPLYEVTKQAYEDAVAHFDPARINAVVLLTDGKNDDGNAGDDSQQLQDLLNTLRAGNEGQQSHAVRVFPIAYGADADSQTLKAIADASSSTFYSATNATTINQVLTTVISNF